MKYIFVISNRQQMERNRLSSLFYISKGFFSLFRMTKRENFAIKIIKPMLLIKNFTKNKINGKFLRLVAKKSIENIPAVKKIADLEIDFAIAGEKRMRRLNRIWRGKDRATDVLSFESGRLGKNKKDFIFAPGNIFHLGEIIVCYPVAARQAKEKGHSLDKEIAVLLIHGILHLAGYDHEKSASGARKMLVLQEKIAGKLGNKKSRVSVMN